MDTQKIKALLLADKYKSLSKAAADFSYAPSAFSHSVRALEQELGIQLLDRTHTGVALSPAGKALQDKLQAVLDAEAALQQAAAALSASQRNHLRLGTYSSVSVNLMPQILGGFKEQHPEVSVSITVGNKVSHWLDQDIADVVICASCQGYGWIPLFQDEFVAVVPETLFPGQTSIRTEALYPYPFIETENLSHSTDIDLSRFRERIVVNAADDMSAVSMVRAGMGVTILPALVMQSAGQGVRTLPLTPQLHRTLGLCYREDLSANSGAMKFVVYLKKWISA